MPRRILALLALGLLCEATPAVAQDLSAGYQFVRLSEANGVSNLPQGFGVDYAHPIAERWRAVGVFGWARKTQAGLIDAFQFDARLTQMTLGGGVRYVIGTQTKASPYVQAVAGLARSSVRARYDRLAAIDDASSDLMFQPGIGVTSTLSGRLSAFGQIDYRRVWFDDNSEVFFHETVQALRVFVGARVKIL